MQCLHASGVLSPFFPSHSAQDLHTWMRVIQGFHWVIERLDFVQDKRGQKVLCLGEEAPQCANTEAKKQCGSCTIRMSKLEVQKKQPCSAFNAWVCFLGVPRSCKDHCCLTGFLGTWCDKGGLWGVQVFVSMWGTFWGSVWFWKVQTTLAPFNHILTCM